jgi:hypothetical protein
MGVGYGYGQAEFDSGIGLVSLISGYENAENHTFMYQVDEIFSGPDIRTGVIPGLPSSPGSFADVVYDNDEYHNSYDLPDGDYGPEHLVNSSVNEMIRVAIFASNKLRVTTHEFEIPIEFKWDVNDRVHVVASAGPTLSLFNSSFETTLYAQELTGVALTSRRTRSQNSYTVQPLFADANDDRTGVNISGGGATKTNSVGGGAAGGGRGQTVQAAGKSANVNAPRLPGRNLATWRSRNREQDTEFGAFAQLGVQIDLDAQDRWFAEFFARYHWVDEFTVSNAFNTATIDPSSWALGLGLGVRF